MPRSDDEEPMDMDDDRPRRKRRYEEGDPPKRGRGETLRSRWKRLDSGHQVAIIWAAAFLGVAILLAIVAVFEIEHQRNFKRYTRDDFSAAVMGKTESEVSAILGGPDLSDREPWNSPQANKRCYGYVLGEGGRKWTVAGHDGGIVLYFSADTGRVDHIQYVPRPQKQGNGFIFIRF